MEEIGTGDNRISLDPFSLTLNLFFIDNVMFLKSHRSLCYKTQSQLFFQWFGSRSISVFFQKMWNRNSLDTLWEKYVYTSVCLCIY